VAKFKYFGGTQKKKHSFIHDEIKSGLNQNHLFTHLLSKYIKHKYTNYNLAVISHGCETWFLTERQENRLVVFENRLLRRLFAPKGQKETGVWIQLHGEELSDR
jgi:hypothetical protein